MSCGSRERTALKVLAGDPRERAPAWPRGDGGDEVVELVELEAAPGGRPSAPTPPASAELEVFACVDPGHPRNGCGGDRGGWSSVKSTQLGAPTSNILSWQPILLV
jgi:hypothetical protein